MLPFFKPKRKRIDFPIKYYKKPLETTIDLDLTEEFITSQNYKDLESTQVKNLVEDTCNYFGVALSENKTVVLENQKRVVTPTFKNPFGIHLDSDGPIGKPCISCLVYYDIGNIENNFLNFYDYDARPYYGNELVAGCLITNNIIIAFDHCYHNASEYFVDELSPPQNRYILAIFIEK
jgi:hypothetical protein